MEEVPVSLATWNLLSPSIYFKHHWDLKISLVIVASSLGFMHLKVVRQESLDVWVSFPHQVERPSLAKSLLPGPAIANHGLLVLTVTFFLSDYTCPLRPHQGVRVYAPVSSTTQLMTGGRECSISHSHQYPELCKARRRPQCLLNAQ